MVVFLRRGDDQPHARPALDDSPLRAMDGRRELARRSRHRHQSGARRHGAQAELVEERSASPNNARAPHPYGAGASSTRRRSARPPTLCHRHQRRLRRGSCRSCCAPRREHSQRPPSRHRPGNGRASWRATIRPLGRQRARIHFWLARRCRRRPGGCDLFALPPVTKARRVSHRSLRAGLPCLGSDIPGSVGARRGYRLSLRPR